MLIIQFTFAIYLGISLINLYKFNLMQQDQRISTTQQQIPLCVRSMSVCLNNFDYVMENNKIWASQKIKEDPDYFKRLCQIQKPQYLWIGCSDSRVPANQIVGLNPGQLFVHRNVANVVSPSDINVLAVIQYSVQVLKVKDIIVTGHYGCGGVKAAFTKHDHGPLESWLSMIRQTRSKYKKQIQSIKQMHEKQNLLVQLNVKQQVYNLGRIPMIQKAWKEGQQLRIHGLVYKLDDGLLKDLGLTIYKISQLPSEFRIYE